MTDLTDLTIELTDLSAEALDGMLGSILERKQTLRYRINTIKENDDMTKLHTDYMPGYESEIKSLEVFAAKISTAIVCVKDQNKVLS